MAEAVCTLHRLPPSNSMSVKVVLQFLDWHVVVLRHVGGCLMP